MGNRYVEAAERYMRDVVSGAVPACKWVRLAVERQVRDLKRPLSPEWPYVFDADFAARPCEFIELLPHIKGKWVREGLLITLEDWQCFILTTVFGWVHRETQLRRFREGYGSAAQKRKVHALQRACAVHAQRGW